MLDPLKFVKTPDQIIGIRKACKLAAEALKLAISLVRPGTTTFDIDLKTEAFIRSKGGIPAFKGYRNFPATICSSINEQVVHGIPGKRKIKDCDIVSIDVGVILDGYIGDTAETVIAGKRQPQLFVNLITRCRECLYEGISQCKLNNTPHDVGTAISKLANSHGFNVMKGLCGHATGIELHEGLEIPNCPDPTNLTPLLEGMVLAVEPMLTKGSGGLLTKADGWTICTEDSQPSAHCEHTILITANGPEILT